MYHICISNLTMKKRYYEFLIDTTNDYYLIRLGTLPINRDPAFTLLHCMYLDDLNKLNISH